MLKTIHTRSILPNKQVNDQVWQSLSERTQLWCLGGSETQYWILTTSELSTSVVGPTNQPNPAKNKTPASDAVAKLNVATEIGYCDGSINTATENIKHVNDT